MSKINLTNRQARIIAENIFAEIKASVDLKAKTRKDKELASFIKKVKSEPKYIKLVKAEEEVAKAVKSAKLIKDTVVGDIGTSYRYTTYFGESLAIDDRKPYSVVYLDARVKEEFEPNYGTTVEQLESKVVLTVIGKDNIDSLIKEIKAEYIK